MEERINRSIEINYKPIHVALCPAIAQSGSGYDSRVDKRKVEQTSVCSSAKQMVVFDRYAMVLYDLKSGFPRLTRNIFIGDAELHPDYFCSDLYGLVYNWPDFIGFAKNVYYFNLLSQIGRYIQKGGVTFDSEYIVEAGVYRVNGVSDMDKVFGNAMAWFFPFCGNTNNGNVFKGFKYFPDSHG